MDRPPPQPPMGAFDLDDDQGGTVRNFRSSSPGRIRQLRARIRRSPFPESAGDVFGAFVLWLRRSSILRQAGTGDLVAETVFVMQFTR